MNTLRQITTLGRITMLEGARKHVFHVLVLFALFQIFGSVLIAKFDQHVQIKILNDLAVFAIYFAGTVIAITLTVTSLPAEIEQRTIYPVIAKPLSRTTFILGKYFGALGTVAIAMVIMVAAFSFLQYFYMGHIDPVIFYVCPFIFLETALIASISQCLSTVCSWPLAWFISVVLGVLGTLKFSIYDSLMSHHPILFDVISIKIIYHLLPSLESFNFKDALVHHLTVPNIYLVQTALYGVVYIAAMLTLSSLTFAKKDL